MSMILQENWDFLSREHELFMQDPGYIAWLEQQEQIQSPEIQQEIWDIIPRKDLDGPSL